MIRIGTRGSRLALVQAELVREKILQLFPQESVELVPIVTKGDKELCRPLASFGGKGVFTREIETQLLAGQIDMAVHSAKDMPGELPEGLKLGAVLDREDVRDVLVSRKGIPARALPAGSVVGTSSLRRKLQILNINSGIIIKDLRGNVPTRLKKLREGEYDGIILAAAGLKRLGLDREQDLKYEYFSPEKFLPAAGQGILAVEIREDTLQELMNALNDRKAAAQLRAERRFLAELGGGCNAPCGVYCEWGQNQIKMMGMYAPDGVHSRCCSMMIQESVKNYSVMIQESEKIGNTMQEQAEKAEKQSAEEKNVEIELLEEMAKRLADRLKKGQVILVGAGPGRKDCISKEGLAWVRRGEVIVYDNLISPSILNEAALDAKLIYVGKRASDHAMSQENIQELLIREAELGRDVVRLKGGDPFVFGRGGEELLALRARGIPVQVVPGISSAYSVPASVGIPITHRKMASSVHIVTGHEGEKEQESIDYTVLAKESGTLVFLMGLGRIREICDGLIRGGKSPELPVAVISRGLTARQRSVFGSLSDIADKVEEAGLTTPAIIVAGEVVSLAEAFEISGKNQKEENQIFGKKNPGEENQISKEEGLAQRTVFSGKENLPKEWLPLVGKRILLTGTRRQAKQLEPRLTDLGGEAVCLSLVETRRFSEREEAHWTETLSDYQWIVFTSAKGVEAFFEELRTRRLDRRKLSGVRFAVVGASTGEALWEQGYNADFIPSAYTSATMAEELCPELAATDRVLLVRGRRGAVYLEKALTEKGIAFDRAVLYETVTDNRRGEELNRIYDDIDYVVITSGSGAEALASMLSPDRLEEMGKTGLKDISGRDRPKLVAIGPETAKACAANGLTADMVAAVYDSEGIVQTIVADAQEYSF